MPEDIAEFRSQFLLSKFYDFDTRRFYQVTLYEHDDFSGRFIVLVHYVLNIKDIVFNIMVSLFCATRIT